MNPLNFLGLNLFNQLPLPARIGAGVALALGAVGLSLLLRPPMSVVIVLVVAVVLIGAAMLVYTMLLRQMERRKASPMFKALASNAAAAPTGIAEPARRARLDDLRKNFETGVEKFRAAGKNLYALPWYAVVGEPGSGKTEAIRHCNVGFPPGLQDQLQGAGGTLNMNWWFTNHAVILDTAGRLMFEEVEPGTSSEWQEFLKLLKKNRPNCPINGMLLVIPAESLIRDSSESLERKGGKIAQQLDSIQRALGVRFPVFVIITKCDLINGFREFFDEINDPQLQHQILGWSNPASLDTPFNPELVDQHLRTVQERLSRRRTGLLLDPVNTEDSKARRTNQVDALYAFPDAMMKIAPRLKRYLEMIFVSGEWSAMPLFLRGIYFTSAMREGAALDAELAQALGVPVESLPEGRVWTRERSFFLRDLFMSKVFKERGLVTRASNTTKLQRVRRQVLIATAGVGLLVIAGLTFLGYTQLKGSIGGPSAFWQGVTKAYAINGRYPQNEVLGVYEEFYLPIVKRNNNEEESFRYMGGAKEGSEELKELALDPTKRTRGQLPLALKDAAEFPIVVPLVFRPVTAFEGNLLKGERQRAARIAIEGSVLKPLISATMVRLKKDEELNAPWTIEATQALAQLARLEVASINGANAPIVDPEPLLMYAVKGKDKGKDEELTQARSDAPALRSALAYFYGSEGGGVWPPESLKTPLPGAPVRRELLKAMGERFVSAWSDSAKSPSSSSASSSPPPPVGAAAWAGVRALITDLELFETAERDLWALMDPALEKGVDAEAIRARWNSKYREVRTLADKLSGQVESTLKRESGYVSLREAFKSALSAFREEAQRQHESLLSELKNVAPGADGKDAPLVASATVGADKDRARALVALREALVRSSESIAKDSEYVKRTRDSLEVLDGQLIANPASPAFASRMAIYAIADGRLNAAEDSGAALTKPGATRQALLDTNAQLESDKKLMNEGSAKQSGRGAQNARDLSMTMLELAARARRTGIIARFLKIASASPDAIGDAVKTQASESPGPARPRVAMMKEGVAIQERFNPGAAATVLGDYMLVSKALSASPTIGLGGSASQVLDRAGDLSAKFKPATEAAAGYLRQYAQYWSTGLVAETPVTSGPGWTKFTESFRSAGSASAVNTQLAELQRLMDKASTDIRAVIEPDVLTPEDRSAFEKLARSASIAKQTLDNESFKAQTDELFKAWGELSKTPSEARQQLITLASKSGGGGEFVLQPDDSDSTTFVRTYWRDLARAGAQSLAREPGGIATKAVTNLLAQGRPLGTKGEMTLADLEAARSQFAQVRPLIEAGERSGGGGGGISSGDTEVDRLIKEIQEQERIPPKDIEAMSSVADMLTKVLSPSTKVTLSVLPDRPPSVVGSGGGVLKSLILDQNPDIGLSVGGGDPRFAVLKGRAPVVLGVLESPGPAFKIEYGVDALKDKVPLTQVPFDSPWGPLALLWEKAAERKGAGVFEVELAVPFNGAQFSLWLRLEFDKALPKPLPWEK